MSAFSGSIEKEIDEYQVESNDSSGSYESSSDSSSQEEYYFSEVPRFPLKDFQEEMQHRAASGTEASSSRRGKSSSPLQDEEEDANVIYSCALEVASILDVNRLTTFVGRYQIPLSSNLIYLEWRMLLFSYFWFWCICLLFISKS